MRQAEYRLGTDVRTWGCNITAYPGKIRFSSQGNQLVLDSNGEPPLDVIFFKMTFFLCRKKELSRRTGIRNGRIDIPSRAVWVEIFCPKTGERIFFDALGMVPTGWENVSD